ncbi:MAG: low affinity iron permease family protein, partial [Proteobacteria bacterium]|nr:low affinity iron permease family protein [Pseudomonadota bacterium]
QLVINTGTTIVTILMVFLIQRAQYKDALAIQLKLNELVAGLDGASNHLIDVENLSSRAIDLEVRERIPVAREGDDQVEVTLGKVEPAWEPWSPPPDAPGDRRLRGGQRWRLTIPASTKRTLRAGYEVKIASKLELVGGNRRER